MKNYTVTNRDGKVKPLNISKIQKQTIPAVKGLKNVSQSELEVDVANAIYDGISTESIQNLLIKSAVDKIDIDVPDWTYVASRLYLNDLYHKCNKEGIRYGEGGLKTYCTKAVELKLMYTDIMVGFDMDKLNDSLNIVNDELFTYLGIKTLFDRYLLKIGGVTPLALPQFDFMSICMFLAIPEKLEDRTDKAIEFYGNLTNLYMMNATPTLSNARRILHNLSSCFIGSAYDSLEGVNQSNDTISKGSKLGGGFGWDWANVRASNSVIGTNINAAGGPIPFLKITDSLSIAFDQLGIRKASIAVYLEPWHLDIIDFIDTKSNAGEHRRRTHELFPALWIPDLFMQRASEDGDWYLFDPNEVPDLHELYGEEFEEAYQLAVDDETIRKEKISAKELWKHILKSYLESGAPFLTFKDTANKRNMNSHSGVIRSTNLCVTGDTTILTKNGERVISELVGEEVECWNGKEWSLTPIFKTSESEEVWEVKLSNGKSLVSTGYHKWYIYDEDGEEVEVRTNELRALDVIINFNLPDGTKNSEELVTVSGVINKKKASTYCGTEPKRNRLVFNGILTGNCTEIFQNTCPGLSVVVATMLDGSEIVKPEYSNIITKSGHKLMKDVTSLDEIPLVPYTNIKNELTYTKVYQVDKKIINREIAICNLASVNISKVNTRELLEKVITTGVRMLDNTIDVSQYPEIEIKDTAMRTRAIGVGIMGEAELIASKQILFGSYEHMEFINGIMESIAFFTIKASIALAKERGAYSDFEGSKWSEGKFPWESWVRHSDLPDFENKEDWDSLRPDLIKYGVRNGYLMAIAPTSTISILTGTTSCIEPVYKRKFFEENLSGLIPVVAPNLNLENINYYTPAYEVDQFKLIMTAAIRQKWLDQGQSLNIFLKNEDVSGKYLNDIYMSAWQYGLKSTYYLRSESPDIEKVDIIDRSQECKGCQ